MSELSREQLLMAIISGKGPPYLRGVDLTGLDLSKAGWLIEADLREANLSGANLGRANLRNCKLKKVNLHASNLGGADLEGANLSKARLDLANLRLANLSLTNLRKASLVGTNLMKANLTGADLEGADLEGANLQGANLENAKLNLANLRMANVQGVNLQGASCLGTILDNAGGLQDPPLPSKGFAGSIGHIELTDLIQLLCLSGTNLRIQVESSHGTGSIHLRSGRVYHAQSGTVEGEKAFLEMLQWANGRFETLPLNESVTATINKPLEHLLLESMRRRDELNSFHDKEKCGRLLTEIKRHMPISAYPSKELLDLIGKMGKEVDPGNELQISDAFNSEDTGNIFCSILAEEDVFIAPLNFITIKQDHPLFDEILEYQKGSCTVGASVGSGSK